MITRASNATKRPGQVVVNSGTRRPKEVVEAERASKAAEKEKIAATEKEGVEEVARIENDARKKKDLGPQAYGQRSKVTIPRATRVRKPRAATPVDQGKLSPLVNKQKLTSWAIQMMITPSKPSHSQVLNGNQR